MRFVSGLPRKVCIVAVQGMVRKGNPANYTSPKNLIKEMLINALREARLGVHHIDGLIAVPSLAESHFMEAHYQATTLGFFRRSGLHSIGVSEDKPNIRCRTIDTGGAGPITALLEGARMIKNEFCEVVCILAGDSVGSLDSTEFLKKADSTCQSPDPLPSPVIPHGYGRITRYQLDQGKVTRDQLRLAVVLDSIHASMHPGALYKGSPLTLDDVRASPTIVDLSKHEKLSGTITASNVRNKAHVETIKSEEHDESLNGEISLLECARRADGAAAIILASNRFLARQNMLDSENRYPTIIGSGEASGPLYPPEEITEAMFSCEDACSFAYEEAQLGPEDIDFFGLYDCFPVCLVRAIEACGLSKNGGQYLEDSYKKYLETGTMDHFPINTHGGLLCYGAPWEVPAAFNIMEAVAQLRGNPLGRKVENCRRALVYGNGGIFSASSVAIIGNGKY